MATKTVKVKVIKGFSLGGDKNAEIDKTIDLPVNLARIVINSGRAVEVKPKPADLVDKAEAKAEK